MRSEAPVRWEDGDFLEFLGMMERFVDEFGFVERS